MAAGVCVCVGVCNGSRDMAAANRSEGGGVRTAAGRSTRGNRGRCVAYGCVGVRACVRTRASE